MVGEEVIPEAGDDRLAQVEVGIFLLRGFRGGIHQPLEGAGELRAEVVEDLGQRVPELGAVDAPAPEAGGVRRDERRRAGGRRFSRQQSEDAAPLRFRHAGEELPRRTGVGLTQAERHALEAADAEGGKDSGDAIGEEEDVVRRAVGQLGRVGPLPQTGGRAVSGTVWG